MALMPEVQFLLSDPDLGAQRFTITRKTGKWQGGRLVIPADGSGTKTINAIGIIVPPSEEQLEFFPEGERRTDRKAIYSKTMMYVSEGKEVSDEVTWRGVPYRVLNVQRWDDYGFCVAFAVKKG